jgi:hypothetical protein
MSSREIGYIRISHACYGELFDTYHFCTAAEWQEALLLPSTYAVCGVVGDGTCWYVYVLSDTLPATQEGTLYPEVTPIYARDDTHRVRLTAIEVYDRNEYPNRRMRLDLYVQTTLGEAEHDEERGRELGST